MSRHGSGKRRRTSPDPDDTGAPRPDTSPLGGGEYTSDEAADEYPPTGYDPTEYPSPAYEPAEYEPYSSGEHPVQYSSGDQPEPYSSGEHSVPYSGEHPVPTYGASAYDPATDPALMGGTAEFAAVVDEPAEPDRPRSAEPRPTEPHDTEPPDTDTGMRPAPPPHEGDIIKLVAVGSLIWFALFVVAWFMRDSLAEDREWWPWCALAGSGLGLFGLWYCRRLQNDD
ncbi:DUF2530 domain-containing protein [Embleya sp. NPDC005971]|uniref:DUF2530 domain-containing protein n=1 Tax=unclassified Embleya TaxID=2699296 RepID=UPI0033FA91C2